MLLLSADSPLGLQTLISADADASSSSSSSSSKGGGGGNVATRTIAASPSAVRCLANGCELADGGGRGGKEEEERGGGGSGGCWVSYGWRRLPRRLPPAIQSPRGLVRERTADGRLVISREEAAHRVSARKVKDRRLVLELVDDERSCGAAAPPPQQRRRWSHPLVGQAAKASSASAAGGEESPAPAPTASSSPVAAVPVPVPVPVPPVPTEACFEGAIREAASLRETRMSLPRMVH